PWRLLSPQLVEEQSGNAGPAADGVVVARSVPAQSGVTARFLTGFYAGLSSAGIPAVGVERLRETDSTIDAFAREDLSTVDDLDSEAGRLSLALLLAGAPPGNYGVKKSAHDGVLPAIPTGGCRLDPRRRPRRGRADRSDDRVVAASVPGRARDRRRRRLPRRHGRRGRSRGRPRRAPAAARQGTGARARGARRAARWAAPLRRRPRRGPMSAARDPCRPRDRFVRGAAGRRFRARQAHAARADPAYDRTRAPRAALRPARPLDTRPRALLPDRGGVRRRRADDGRCAQGRADGDGGRAAAAAPSDRPRPARLRPPRASARRRAPRLRAGGAEPPRPAAAARRLGRRRPAAARRRGRGDRARRRPARGTGARVCRPPPRGTDDWSAEARRYSARRP